MIVAEFDAEDVDFDIVVDADADANVTVDRPAARQVDYWWPGFICCYSLEEVGSPFIHTNTSR